MKIKLIAGIGNNINKYLNTRHNIGFFFIKILSNKNKKFIYNKKINGFLSEVNLNNKNIILLIPNSYMNIIGININDTLNYFNLNSKEIMIVHDDIYFNPGIIKIKVGGGSAGHKGIENIINNINNNFYRLRIGIGNPKFYNKNINDFVLSKPNLNDIKLITNAINEFINKLTFVIK